MQVGGRSGRAGLPGEVLVQTAYPEHPLYRALAAHDFERFAQSQLRNAARPASRPTPSRRCSPPTPRSWPTRSNSLGARPRGRGGRRRRGGEPVRSGADAARAPCDRERAQLLVESRAGRRCRPSCRAGWRGSAHEAAAHAALACGRRPAGILNGPFRTVPPSGRARPRSGDRALPQHAAGYDTSGRAHHAVAPAHGRPARPAARADRARRGLRHRPELRAAARRRGPGREDRRVEISADMLDLARRRVAAEVGRT